MKFFELVKKSRSYRRFDESVVVDRPTLTHLVEHARFSAASLNIQPLKYILLHGDEGIEKVFPLIKWAGYLKDWDGPVEGERPTGYIVILGDTDIRKKFVMDCGIAAQTIMLAAANQGLGGCMIGNVNKNVLREVLDIPEKYEIVLILTIGKPAEEVVLTDVGVDGNIKYYRDENDVHFVPKRTMDELVLK